ncbi:MAG: ribonuclease HI family protein [Candidatus Caldatribacteriota bacterium]
MEADLYFDGASKGNPGQSGVGVRIIDTNQRKTICEKSIYIGHATNNVAEYMGLVNGLEIAQKMNINKINIFSDSLLVVNHINGKYKISNSRLKPLYDRSIELLNLFGNGYTITHIPRAQNSRADELANKAVTREN